MDPLALALLADVVDKEATPTGFCKAAALAWLLYDYVLTFDNEVEYIWKRSWGTVTCLYFLTRYLPLAIVITSSLINFLPDVSASTCNLFQWIEAIATFVMFIVVQVVLQFRLYVMYGKSRRVLLANAFLCVLELACAGAMVGLFFPKTIPLPNSPRVFGSCFSASPSEIAVVLVAPLAYETYLALLALRKTFQDTRSAVGRRTSLMTLLIRDNIIYFFLIAGTLIFVTLTWFFLPVSPGNSLITFTHVSGSIGGARLIVNVRHAALARDPGAEDADAASAAGEGAIGFRGERSRRSFHASQGASFGAGHLTWFGGPTGGRESVHVGMRTLSAVYAAYDEDDAVEVASTVDVEGEPHRSLRALGAV